ncbi:type II toxin-antitoxin system Phd/YefM family antitoxin [Fimbriimonas ginsengisoli]|uniref:Prevent-host-death family protein n=1 Tax=Fimbriimonas ginsengisoli Gsoil 348 TaxID=661478 RepID=A0A068NNK3_FIMGI|nr:type II toxin-antitoxin system prevent-host-death family antitoxin [Fimbriimonas ginsengisoli]AIE84982.1 prevent-host-death family protein [Fimbriimonas ginsengisoli Gsoil 348]
MRTITATEFKAKCLEILDHVPQEGIKVTKRGKPVARIYPENNGIMDLCGSAPGIYVGGDILSTGEKWDAES